MPIEPGLVNELNLVVTPALTAAAAPIARMAPVLSTPNLVSLMEQAAHEAVLPFFTETQSGVGAGINIRHLAATPVGMRVRVRAELLEVDGRRLRFKVEAWDEVEKIGEGEHERFIIDFERFLGRVEKKKEQIK